MRKGKKVLCLALAVVLAAALLTACQPAAEEKTRLDAIKEAGVLVVGTSPDYPPYEFIIAGEDGSMETVGIDMWIAADIAKRSASSSRSKRWILPASTARYRWAPST